MNRKLKVLGLALAAAFVLSAVSATAASAEQFHSETEKTFLKGEQVGTYQFDTTTGSTKCTKVTYTGEVTSKTFESFTLTPEYSGCTSFGLPSVVHMNGCTYLYTRFIAHLMCPAGKSMTITHGNPVTCTTHRYTGSRTFYLFIGEGAGATRDLTNTSEAGEGTEYEVTYPKGEKEGKCGIAGVHTDGNATGSFTLKGYKNAALTEQVGIWLE